MKRIAVLEYVGCQDYLDPTSNAIANLPATRELLREGDAMLFAIATDWMSRFNVEVHCCRHESIGVPLADGLRGTDVGHKKPEPMALATGDLATESVLTVPEASAYGSEKSAFLSTQTNDDAILHRIHWHAIPSGDNYLEHWLRVALACDQAIIIAPEIDGVLLDSTRFLRSHGVDLVNADERFIATASDKWLTAECWESKSIRQPKTRLLRNGLLCNAPLEQQTFDSQQPWVIKPRDGAGGVGIRRFRCLSEALSWGRDFGCDTDNLLLQPWLQGRPMSIAFVFSEGECVQVTEARDQLLAETLSSPSDGCWTEVAYIGSGSSLPAEHQRVAEAFARSAIEAIPGEPRGWIGLDFLCDGDPGSLESYIAIEVNPRLTSSYCL
jgi:predicted ATP-grasp superfamily ATP-dependent carboligase